MVHFYKLFCKLYLGVQLFLFYVTIFWGEWTETKPATPDEKGEETRTCPHCNAQETRELEYVPGDDTDNNGTTLPGTDIPDTDIPLGDLPTGSADAATTSIEDEETPLAGLVTLAELLEALRQYEGIEDVELPEDFQWADHDYAQAIYWGLEEALVIDTEDAPLDPDEIVTIALLREVLENFVAYKGLTDFPVTVEGEDDMIVIDLGERLTVFYGELETALAAKAA